MGLILRCFVLFLGVKAIQNGLNAKNNKDFHQEKSDEINNSISEELEKLNVKRTRKNTLLLDLLAKKSNEINHISHDLRHTDDIIYDLAVNHQLAVLTVDKNLKRRLFTSGIDVVEVVKNNHLNLIEGL